MMLMFEIQKKIAERAEFTQKWLEKHQELYNRRRESGNMFRFQISRIFESLFETQEGTCETEQRQRGGKNSFMKWKLSLNIFCN